MDIYLSVLKKYAEFSGRAARKEFWTFVLCSMIIGIVLTIVDIVLGTGSAGSYGLFSSIYSLAVIVPSLAVAWRRLHDTGKSGAWYFIILIPLLGAIVLIVFLATDSHAGDNQYGPNPKEGG